MKRILIGFGLMLFLLPAASGTAYAQEESGFALRFDAPELTLRTGAVQSVSAENDGLAPYAEAQLLLRPRHSVLGMAVHGGLSYERGQRTYRICPFAPPCFEEEEQLNYLDLVSGLRAGFFPPSGPVNLFVGLAAHTTRQARRFEQSESERDAETEVTWRLYPTAQAGVDVQFPLTRRLDLGAGAVGFVPIYSGEANPLEEEDMSRIGAHLNFEYVF